MRCSESISRVALALGCLLAPGCAESTAPALAVPSALIGTWVGDTLRHTPRGMTTVSLVIQASGRFTWTVRTTGLYPGQAPNELTNSSREIGHLATMDQRALFRSDSVYFVSVPDRSESVRRVEPASGGFGNSTLFDSAQFNVGDDVLELTYLSYPADAPVETSRRFIRVK